MSSRPEGSWVALGQSLFLSPSKNTMADHFEILPRKVLEKGGKEIPAMKVAFVVVLTHFVVVFPLNRK